MASAAIWLEELGIPPHEICLDWAWQIQTQFATLQQKCDEEVTSLSWQQIEVKDEGELVLPNDLRSYSPKEVLQELLNWTRGEVASAVTSSSGQIKVEIELRSLIAASLERRQSSLAEDSNFLATTELAIPKANPIRSRASKKSGSNVASQVIVALKQYPIVTTIGSLVLIFGFFIAFNALRTHESSEPLKAPEITHPTAEASLQNESEVEDAKSLDSLVEMPQFGAIEPEAFEAPRVALPSVSTSVLGELSSSTSAERSEATVSEAKSMPAETLTSDARTSEDVTQATSDSAISNRDVMEELDSLAKSAAKNAIESDIEAADPERLDKIAEPILLQTSPMLQTQKLASKIKVRPRQPVWHIELSVDDEFKLTPNEPQNVTDRQVTTWFIADSNAKSPQTRMVIQAQMASGRTAALRWRVFAGAEDIPNLMIPLEKELLQPLQDRLRNYSRMAQNEADRLKQFASTAEKEMRTKMSKQRTSLESQSKLASRLSTVVAEAQLLDDLLRSQITVFAKLKDGDGIDAPTLLKFGDIDSQLKDQKESE